MKKILSITITILFVFAAKPAFAQADAYNIYGPSDINYTLSPKNPGPGQEVTITLSSFAIDINRSDISWSVNGQSKTAGVGAKTLKVSTSTKDDVLTVVVNINIPNGESISKQIIISTKSVDVLWEVLDGYAPPFYKGKILPTSESRIKATAMPNSNENNTYITKWKLNSNVLGGGANANNMSIEYKNSYLKKTDEISLEAGDMSGNIGNTKLIYINIQEPQILFYKIDGIFGTLYNKNINKIIDMTTNNIKISAEPYFFAPRNIRDGQLSFRWTVNGNTVDTPKKKNILGFELSDNKNGRAEIGLKIESIPKLMLLQEVKVPVNINIK